MRDFGNGWSGLKDYAVKVGFATVDDSDDVVASKIKSLIQATGPEEDDRKEPDGDNPTLGEKIASAVGMGGNVSGD